MTDSSSRTLCAKTHKRKAHSRKLRWVVPARTPITDGKEKQKSGSGSKSKSNSKQGGTTQQKKAAGRKGGKAASKSN